MATAETRTLEELYREDETAWLDAMAELARLNRVDALDYGNLAEYLTDMAARDRREVRSRLVMLLMHLLKLERQPDNRSPSWRTTVVVQRQELADLAGRGVLRIHAESVLNDAYRDAVERAASETGLGSDAFPPQCPWTVEQLLAVEL